MLPSGKSCAEVVCGGNHTVSHDVGVVCRVVVREHGAGW